MSERFGWLRLPPDIIGGALSGLLLAFAFPRPGLGWLAWFALVPLLLVGHRRPFRSGFSAGICFFALILYWLNLVMTTYGRLAWPLAVAAYLMLVIYLALYFGLVTSACCWLRRRLNLSLVWSFPPLWVAAEFLRAHALTGFPWASIGYSQIDLASAQIADFSGVYGVGFLLACSNAMLADAFSGWQEKRLRCLARVPVVALLIAAAFAFGHWRLVQENTGRHEVAIAMVQGNVEQGVKWDPAYRRSILDRYLAMTDQAAALGADLVIWPEAATPFQFQAGGEGRTQMEAAARRNDIFLLFGSPASEGVGESTRYFNSAYLLGTDGQTLGRSDKIHLVPFGEYVPLQPLLPFVDKLVVGIGDFSPGRVKPLALDGHSLGMLICYEAIFPELARRYVAAGSDLLVNITNDAWFGNSSAPWQHLAMTRMRAIENRTWVARVANTGISALIDPTGAVRSQSGLFTTEIVVGKGGFGGGSLYTRWGDWLPWLCLLISVCLLGFAWGKTKGSLRRTREKS